VVSWPEITHRNALREGMSRIIFDTLPKVLRWVPHQPCRASSTSPPEGLPYAGAVSDAAVQLPPPGRVTVSPALAPDAVTGVMALVEAAAAADGVAPLSEHVMLHLRHGGDDADRHLLLLVPDGHGAAETVAGYAHLDPTDPVDGASAELVVHPAHRGHGYGRLLVATTLEVADRAAGVHAGGGARLRLWAHGDHPAARALASSMGFEEVRRLLQLRRSLTEQLPPVELPPGVLLRTFRPGVDDEAWLALNALAFADHPEQGKWTMADLHARMAESWFDASGFLIAELWGSGESEAGSDAGGPDAGGPAPGGRMAGFHWTKVHGGDDPQAHGHDPIGEVYVVGVDPAAQGSGLGRALTLAGLHRLRGLGLAQAMLYVEADNAPALAVYGRLGFTRWDVDVMFRRRAAPSG
jgi:mycothiol synthase